MQVARLSLGHRMADGSEDEAIEWSFDVVLPREIDTNELLKLVAWAMAPLCGVEGEAMSVEVEEDDGQVTGERMKVSQSELQMRWWGTIRGSTFEGGCLVRGDPFTLSTGTQSRFPQRPTFTQLPRVWFPREEGDSRVRRMNVGTFYTRSTRITCASPASPSG